MRHQNSGRKLNRTSAHREALLSNLAMSLFEHERIQTTTPKAKELRWYAERLITLARRGDDQARRLAARQVHVPAILEKLFSDLGPRFKDRNGGYTRVIHVTRRTGDNAPISIIELVDASEAPVVEMPETATEAATATTESAD
jgi:large subunit ribosomal protein L17